MITVFLSLLETEEEKQSFKKLYYKYVHLMMDIAYKRVSNYSVAEECVQEAFFYVAKNFNKIDDINSTTTRNFLAVITDSFAIKAYHKENKQKNCRRAICPSAVLYFQCPASKVMEFMMRLAESMQESSPAG